MVRNGGDALVYFTELCELHTNNEFSVTEKYKRALFLLDKVCKEWVRHEPILFTNLFSKLSFLCSRYGLSKNIHQFRASANQIIKGDIVPSENDYIQNLEYLAVFISSIFNVDIPYDLQKEFQSVTIISTIPRRIPVKHIVSLRVSVLSHINGNLQCISDNLDSVGEIISVDTKNIEGTDVEFWEGAQLKLVNVDLDEKGVYHPKFVILEPDYLVDVTAIAECFQDYGTSELYYLKNKFEEVPNNQHIRLGNFANLVMDEIVTERGKIIDFDEILLKDFRKYSFEYTVCEDLENRDKFMEYRQKAKEHFNRIKKIVTFDFPKTGITLENTSLEPSFICERYGIQGRLDVLAIDDKKGKIKIVELKSGGVPFPDNGKNVKPNHQVQLFLYYQLIATAYQLNFSEIADKVDGYILYSKVDGQGLRYDRPHLKRIQEIFDMRNRIIQMEHRMAMGNWETVRDLIEQIRPKNLIKSNIFQAFRDIISSQIYAFTSPWIYTNELEKLYFYAYIQFISHEQYLAKVGNGFDEVQNGYAGLWQNSFQEKVDRFEILFDLSITDNKSMNDERTIVFNRTNPDNRFINLREGDSCVLYPRNTANDNATCGQVFKCSLLTISNETIHVQLRNKQSNNKYFSIDKLWALEKDVMDISFTTQYQNLYSFLRSNERKKRLLLTVEDPATKESSYQYQNQKLCNQHNELIRKALNAKDYFLLNGPPGTGKTSIFIKEVTREIFQGSEKKILLLAFTNRAVDELCAAVLEALDDKEGLVRLGGEHSCDKKYHPILLQNLVKQIKSRKELKDLLGLKRIFVSTISSLLGRMELLKLIAFDYIIVDEASQILEPHLVGILPYCNTFILVGDHKQLPAIVLQSPEKALTNNKELEAIGLKTRKNSLFERLYTHCEQNNLTHAYGMLTYQGRMHADIAKFPNNQFYGGKLMEAYNIPNLDGHIKTLLQRQVSPLELQYNIEDGLEGSLSRSRVIFFDTSDQSANIMEKGNLSEAKQVVKIVKTLNNLYKRNNLRFDISHSLGIIAPYRNHIALIKQLLVETGIPKFETITVDTVERYQGSQRDIILLSFGVNTLYQMKNLVNMNDDGTVDRKLNVALTRAKDQLIIIGNEKILGSEKLYAQMIASAQKGSLD